MRNLRVTSAAWLVAGVACMAMTAAGCDLPLYRASETVDDVFSTGPNPKIVVETFNGSIDISNGQDDEVVVEVTKRASGFDQQSAEVNLEGIEVTMTSEDNEVHIRVKRVGHTMGDSGASVVLAAPANATLELKSSNGYIVSEGMRGGLEARTSNAKIDVVDASGSIDITSSNGPILIEAENARVDAGTSNSGIRFRGTLADGDHEFTSSNGPIDVVLPADSQFKFAAATSNGGIDCDFDYDSTSSRSRRRKSGIVGDDPKFSIELTTSNSSIDIRKAKK